jgi:hypothetical protein
VQFAREVLNVLLNLMHKVYTHICLFLLFLPHACMLLSLLVACCISEIAHTQLNVRTDTY